MKYGTAPSIKEPIGRIYHSRKHVAIWEENCEVIWKFDIVDKGDIFTHSKKIKNHAVEI